MPTIQKAKKHKPIPYKRDNTFAQYYNSNKWITLRNCYVHEHPLCENCLRQGIIRPSEEVHHKQFLSTRRGDAWDLLLDEDNLIALCKECHHAFHNYANSHGLNYIDQLNTKHIKTGDLNSH